MLQSVTDVAARAQASDPRRGRRFRLGAKTLGAILGVWISLYPFVDLALRPRVGFLAGDGAALAAPSPLLPFAYLAIIVAGAVAPIAGAISLGVDFRRAKLLALALLPLCLAIPLSLLSATDVTGLQLMLLVDYVFGCGILLVAVNVDGDVLLRSFFTALAVTLGVAMAAAMIDHDFAWGRLTGRMAPNYWGGLGMTAILATIAMRGWVLRSAVIGMGLLVIYSSQSRGELISLTLALGLAAVMFMRQRKAGRWAWVWFAVAFAAVIGAFLGWDFILNDILRISDSRRGLNSGFSGRVDGWREAQALFVSHPWLGVGFLQHSAYMTPNLVVHNGYLATLADTGIVGFLAQSVFVLGALFRSIVRAWTVPTGVRVALASFLLAEALVAFAEPSGLHVGDTLGMLAIVLTAWAWRVEPAAQRRAPDPN